MTITEITSFIYSKLEEKFPRSEIESFLDWLSEYKLGLRRVDRMLLKPQYQLTTEELSYFKNAIERLFKEEPIQYIIGETEFYNLKFKVNSNVIIPRPETEELVDWIVKDIRKDYELMRKPKVNILDIGTGSGPIAISLAKNIRNAKVWALEVSEKALEVAKHNANENGVQIQWLKQDILETSTFPETFDIIVSNPPYIRTAEKEEMQNNVLLYEPPISLYVSNKTPLIFYRKICNLASQFLLPKGKLYFEINRAMGAEMIALMEAHKFQEVILRKDMYSSDRMVRGTFKNTKL